MPREFQRTDRIADAIQREVAKILQHNIRDPRISMVTVSSVEVTKDLSYAKVYVSILANNEKASETFKALQGASGHIRSLLAKAIQLRTVPELRFVYDDSIVRGQHLSQLIEQATKSDARIKKQQDSDSED